MTEYRSGLYVPGDRPDRFDKAVHSGSDLVVFDWEDSVRAENKATARKSVVEYLNLHSPHQVDVQVRITAGSTEDFMALADLEPRFALRLPKVEAVDDVMAANESAPGRSIVALIESALGVVNASSIANAPGVVAVGLGESDLRSDVGGGDAVIDHARVSLVFAARAAGLSAPMGSVFPALSDDDAFAADTAHLATLGFFGRMVIHPRQLIAVHHIFAPTQDEIAWASEVLEGSHDGGVWTLSRGDMVDDAMLGRARQILRRAGSDER